MATKVINDEPLQGANNAIVPRNMKLKTIENRSMDKMIQEKIDILEKIKKQALKHEDYDQCKLLKTIIDKLKIVGNQIFKMN